MMPLSRASNASLAFGKLAFQILMAVVRKVRAELQKERPEVLVHAVEVRAFSGGHGAAVGDVADGLAHFRRPLASYPRDLTGVAAFALKVDHHRRGSLPPSKHL